MRRQVVQLDLRGRTAQAAEDAARGLLADEDHTDLTLLLVVDDAAALDPHRRAYETLLASRYTEHVLCVAVGRTDADPPRIALPGVLTQAAGVLWVPDTGGINWRLAGAAPATRRGKDEETAGLPLLLEVLSLDGVLPHVLELIEGIPGRVANPGLRLAGAGGEGSGFVEVFLAAGERMLSADGGRAPALPGQDGRPPVVPAVRLRKGGALQEAVDEARTAVAEAQGLAEELTETMTLLSGPVPVADATAAAGEHLGRLRDRLETLFTAAHTTVGIAAPQQEAIERAGIVLPDLEDFDAGRTRKVIDEYLNEGLDHGVSLPRLVAGLDLRQEELLPRGSRERIPALGDACSDDLLTRLRNPAPLPGPEPWLPLAGLVTAALAALTPVGAVGGLLMAVLWTLLVVLTVRRGPGGRPADHIGALTGNALAAAAGAVAAGTAAPFSAPPAVWGPAVVAALALAAVAVFRSWRVRTTAWVAGSGLETADKAVDDLLLVAAAASRDWARSGARVATADAIARMSVSLSHVAAELDERVQRLRTETSGTARPDPRVERHLADLVRAAMAPRLAGLAADSAAEHGDNARRSTAELLDVWNEHVRAGGPLDPPPFATALEAPAAAASPEYPADLVTAAAYDARDVMWQLCAADDLPLLDLGSGHPAVVRFAPRHGPVTADGPVPAGTVWVPSARHAGVLRMVPVRPGLTVQSW